MIINILGPFRALNESGLQFDRYPGWRGEPQCITQMDWMFVIFTTDIFTTDIKNISCLPKLVLNGIRSTIIDIFRACKPLILMP